MEKIEAIEQWQQKVHLETKNGAALWKAIHISLILIIFFVCFCYSLHSVCLDF